MRAADNWLGAGAVVGRIENAMGIATRSIHETELQSLCLNFLRSKCLFLAAESTVGNCPTPDYSEDRSFL